MASVNLLALSISPPTSYPEERFLAGYGSISRSCDLDYPIKKQALSRFKFVRNLKNWVEFTVTCFLYQPQTICFRACDKSQYNVARFKINKQLYKWILSFYSMYNLTRQLQGTNGPTPTFKYSVVCGGSGPNFCVCEWASNYSTVFPRTVCF